MLNIGNFIPRPIVPDTTLETLPQLAKDHFYEGARDMAKDHGVDPTPDGIFRALSDFSAQMVGYYSGGRTPKVLYNHQYLPPKRGLLICGSVGTGKTVLTRFFEMILNHFLPDDRKFATIRCYDLMDSIVDEHGEHLSYYRQRIKGKHRIFDDLGPESNAQVYGMPFGMREILIRRYDEWVDFGAMSIITTNLNGSREIAERYGSRIEDRVTEMCDILIMDNKSRRKRNSAKVLER